MTTTQTADLEIPSPEFTDTTEMTLDDALALEDQWEDLGMIHADDRHTCYACQAWADHSHSPFTGAVIR